MINQFINSLLKYRLVIIVFMHLAFSAISLLLSFLFRFDFTFGQNELRDAAHYPSLFYLSLPINVIVFTVTAAFFNLFQGIWRYVSVDDLKDIVKTSAVASAIFMLVIVLSGQFHGYPRSIYVMNFAFFIVLNGGTRFTIRIFRESFVPATNEYARNILIVGAGSAGNEIAKTLKTTKNKVYVPIGFIDRDKATHGKRLQGLKILGDLSSIKNHIKRHRVHEIFIAIPEASNKVVKDIMDASRLHDWDVKFKIVPSMLDIMSGRSQVNKIRDISIDDLLSRPNITLDDTHVRKQLAGKVVMITGAGGSIGSEICHQIAAYNPSRVILLDSSEFNAYNIDKELKSRHKDIAIHTIVESIQHGHVMDMIMRQHKPDFIYHAAAYKHVHLMEWNPVAAMANNVLGTATLANIAEKNGVKQFVMISTDKAVNPKGVMGLSKRLAERVVLERHKSNTLFNIVRFGNVLGSSGSVIPLFQQQIRDGGPISITHPDMRRFFMSIPEAVQLVLQASTLNESNSIFMLEMGEAVKILDLATNLIELSGLKVGEDIEIRFTGLRPGEKIEEELLTAMENLEKTPFEKIRLQRNRNFDPDKVSHFVHELKSHVALADIKSMYKDIHDMVPEMTGPSFDEMARNMFG